MSTPYRDAIITTSPVMAHSFDESSGTEAADYSGNGRDLTHTGPMVGVEDRAITADGGLCVAYDGTDDYSLADEDGFVRPNPPAAIKVWVKTTSTAARMVALAVARPNSSNGWITIGVDEGKAWSVDKDANDNLVNLRSTADVNDDVWHRLVLIVDSTSMRRLIVDDTVVATDDTALDGHAGGRWWASVGARVANIGFGYFEGLIDHPAYWQGSNVPSLSTFAALYAAASAEPAVPRIPPPLMVPQRMIGC